MKTTNLIVAAVISAGLAFGVVAQAHEEKETTVDMKSLPAAVQKTFKAEAKGGKIIRTEKEGADFEAVIEKSGKATGVKVSSDGKVVSRHDESKERGEKAEKH